MHCFACQHEDREEAKFCEACGNKLELICPACGTQARAGAAFCDTCGASLKAKSKGKSQRAKKVVSNQLSAVSLQPPTPSIPHPDTSRAEGERRQLTVMFIDLVGSTALSVQLDPEELREVIRAYQSVCAEVIARLEGYIAQYLGDGLLVYFGYPTAHEDDAQRAVRAGLEIIEIIRGQGTGDGGQTKRQSLQVRIGIHTGPVVVGEIGGGNRREQLALGETPNVAARLQGLAESNTVVLSAMTQRLVAGLFDCQDLGAQALKGMTTPVALYQVLGESTGQHRLDAVLPTGLTPLVGREEELALLHRRWAQTTDREGQVVLLSGEPGIGKSRLVRELRDRVERDDALRLEFRCSPYYQNSAFHPVIEHLQRLLHWQKDDTPQTKLAKLHTTLAQYRFPQADTPILFAALLSLPQPANTPPLNLSPQRQKQKTQEALIAWLVEEAAQAPVYCAWEDLHWVDPSTLELLGMLIDQTPTSRLFVLFTSRPEFTPPWGQHGHFSHLTLSRLGRRQVPQMIEQATRGKTLPPEVVQQIVAKTDGVPLFVEELTKMVVESGLLTETNGHYELSGPLPPLAIPSTLQDSLMARLDRLATTKEIAQVGATLGREFSYDLLHAVSPVDEPLLQQGLSQLVAVELLYQRGTPPQSTYLFKHALIQDTAYQSLLKSRRQQLHQQIAQVLEVQFPDTQATQPELLAHHYTEAGLIAHAIPYWQRAGERASQRSAYVEAINHLTKGLGVLKTLPDTPERARQELMLQIALGPPLIATKGYAAQEVEQAYTRALELCRLTGETAQLFSVLVGLRVFYAMAGRRAQAHDIGEQLLTFAQRAREPSLLVEAKFQHGNTLFWAGEFAAARQHFDRALALYDPVHHRGHATLYGQDTRVASLVHLAHGLWFLGYPAQALQRAEQALVHSRECAHTFSLAYGQVGFTFVHLFRHEEHPAQQSAEATIALAREQGFPFWVILGTIFRGWALTKQGQREEGIEQMRLGISAWRAMGAENSRPQFLALLAEAYGDVGQPEEGLTVLAEGLAQVEKTGERWYEAELYRIRGELTLAQSRVQSLESGVQENQKSENTDPRPLTSDPQSEAEACFLKAIEVSRKQQAKSLELRAVMSLARLWQQQSKQAEAHKMLSEIYNWFTEGFDTKDLQEAKVLLDDLERVNG